MATAKRASFTVEEKQALCLLARANPSWTQDEIAAEFHRTTGREMKKSTLSDILRHQDRWLKVSSEMAAKVQCVRWAGHSLTMTCARMQRC